VETGQFGRGVERVPTDKERRQQQSRDRMEDVNASTRPNQVTMADVKRRG